MERGCLVAVVAAIAIVVGAPAVSAQQEWYIPKRTEVVESGHIELGLREQFSTENDGLLDSRRLDSIVSVRYSPVQRFEAYVEAPYVWAQNERIVNFTIDKDEDNGIGDVFLQLTYEVFGGEDWRILLNLDGTFPTGNDPFDHEVGLGGGFYRVAGGVTALKVIDPVVLFVHLGEQHSFSEEFDVGDVEPGEDVRYRIGANVQFNPQMRAGIHLSGDVIQSTQLEGDTIPGSDNDLVRLGVGLDWSVSERVRLSADGIFGMTDSTPDATVVIGVTLNFGK